MRLPGHVSTIIDSIQNSNTVDSRYLEFRGTIKYFEISVPRHIRFAEFRKKLFEQPHLKNVYVIGLLKLEIRSNFSSFPQYFFCLLLDVHASAGTRLHYEISGYSR